MGNSNSNIQGGSINDNNTKLIEKSDLDSIVSEYILSMDFQNLKKMYDKDYCNRLVNLTADILNRRFSSVELEKIDAKIEGEGEAEGQGPDKQAMCIDIAKFYIKIAHLFSAILMTIHPEYTYTDSSGKKVKKNFSEKDTIPKDAKIEQIHSGLCDKKIQALSDAPLDKKDTCSFNIYSSSPYGLSEEPGIPELKDLYYDADYDLKTGEFKGMSPETKEQYKKDVQQFYKVFTQNTEIPDTIQSFSDIKINDYCKNHIVSKNKREKSELLDEYANNLRNMMKTMKDKQKELLDIINMLFILNPDIHIHPDLTEELLDQLIVQARTLIVELHLKCETDFLEGVKIYEALVELQILKTTEKQIHVLEKEKEKLYIVS